MYKRQVYAQTKGLGNKMITSAVEQALAFRTLERDYLPAGLRIANELAEYNFCLLYTSIAADFEDAAALAGRIICEAYKKTGGYDVNSFLFGKGCCE